MLEDVLDNLKSIEYWHYSPAKFQRTKPRSTTKKAVLGRIKRAFSEPMDLLPYYAEDPHEPRYITILNTSNGRQVGVKVLRNILVSEGKCYETQSGQLRQVLESLPRGTVESVSHCPSLKMTEHHT